MSMTLGGALGLDVDDVRHGTENGYSNLRCRCLRCRAAWAARQRAWRESHPIAVVMTDAARWSWPENEHGCDLAVWDELDAGDLRFEVLA